MAITPNTTFTAGAVLTAAQMNRLPWGVVGVASKTASQTGITAATDVTGLSVTWTADSSRIYMISLHALLLKETNNGLVWLRVTNASNVQSGSFLQTIPATEYAQGNLTIYETGLSGSQTRKVRAEASAASVTVDCASDTPAILIVQDIGQA
jgi:hypothetical protein